MQMIPDEYADYIADATRYQRGQHRWQAVRDRAKRVIDEIVAENERLRSAIEDLPDEVEIHRIIKGCRGRTHARLAIVISGRVNLAEKALKGGAK